MNVFEKVEQFDQSKITKDSFPLYSTIKPNVPQHIIVNDSVTFVGKSYMMDDDLVHEFKMKLFTYNLTWDVLSKLLSLKNIPRHIYIGKINVVSEMDQIISRYMNDIEQTQAMFNKMIKEINQQIFGEFTKKVFDTSFPLMITDGYADEFYLTGNIVTFQYSPTLIYTCNKYVSGVIRELTTVYNVPKYIAVKIALKYDNGRNYSSTNLSPTITYSKLLDWKQNGYTIMECFASILNNWNYLNRKTMMELEYTDENPVVQTVLTFSKYDTIIPFIKGSFPVNIVDHILDLNSKKVLLLISPVPSEHHIYKTFQVLEELSIEPRLTGIHIKILMSLPKWDDIYNSQGFKQRTKFMNMKWLNITNTVVRNFKLTKKVPIKMYSVLVEL